MAKKRQSKNSSKHQTEGVKIEGRETLGKESTHQKREMVVQSEEAPKQFFVQKSMVEEIKKGSLESHIAKIQELAQKNIKSIVGENNASRLEAIATFKNHALVADEYSNVYRLNIESTESGLELKKVESVEEIKKFTAEEIEGTMNHGLSDTLANTIANVEEGCENKLKESFDKMIQFKTAGSADGFINLFGTKEN